MKYEEIKTAIANKLGSFRGPDDVIVIELDEVTANELLTSGEFDDIKRGFPEFKLKLVSSYKAAGTIHSIEITKG